MKKTDYQIKKGTLPLDFQRGVEINGKASALTITLRLNYKKGLHTILPRLNHDQITGNAEDDENTLQTLNELMQEAINYAINWRREWDETNKDKNQLSIFDQPKAEEEEEAPGERAMSTTRVVRRKRNE